MDKPKKDAELQNKAGPEVAVANSPEKQLAEFKDALQRLQADFENYKKRVEKEKAQSKLYCLAEVVKSFLPVLDSFELALKAVAGNEGSDAKLVRGMELLYGQFYSVLESHGLRPIRSVGEKFDPYRHEVLMQEETTDHKKDGVVAEEFQRGYLLQDSIIRYGKVKVFKVKEAKQNGPA